MLKTLREAREMRFVEIYNRHKKKELSCKDAADILGMNVRTFLRKRNRYKEEGEEMRFDLRVGRHSHNRAADSEVEQLTKLYDERYRGFTVKHFYDYVKLQYTDVPPRSYNWYRLVLQQHDLIAKSNRGGPYRLRRERKAMAGMMIHQDGSTHRWIPSLDHNIDLIVTISRGVSSSKAHIGL